MLQRAPGPCRAGGELPPVLPSHLQEAEKQNRGLQQELAALREELRTRGPGGEWPSAWLSWSKPPTTASATKGSHTALQGVETRICSRWWLTLPSVSQHLLKHLLRARSRHRSLQSLPHFTEVETEAPTGPWVLRNKCQGWARDPNPSDPHPLFSDTKSSNSLIPFLPFRSSEVRTRTGLVGEGPGERHRGLDFAPKPQKDSAKDPGISGEAPRPGVEPELRPEGRRSLRLGVRTAGTCSSGPCALCPCDSHLFACPPPQAVFPRGPAATPAPAEGPPAKVSAKRVGRGGGHHAILLGFQGPSWFLPPAPWPADHVVGGGDGDGFERCHTLTGLRAHAASWLSLWSCLTLQGCLRSGEQGPGRLWSDVNNGHVPPQAWLTHAAPPEFPVPHQVSALHLADAGPGPPGPGL